MSAQATRGTIVDMNIQLRSILLKSVPYMLSIAGGITLFVLTKDNIHNPSVADLIDNIAASLLSIPVVFLLYDYSNYRISRKLSKTMANNMSSRISTQILGLIILIRQMLGMRGKVTLETINKMQDLSTNQIAARLKINTVQMQSLHAYHNNLENLIYQYGKNNIFDTASLQTLSGLSLDLLRLMNEHQFHGNKKSGAKYISDLISRIVDWLDSDAGASMDFQKLLSEAQNPKSDN